MKVIDDEGNHPAFLHSLKRNVLCLANLYPVFTEYTSNTVTMGRRRGTQMNFRMHLNNTICKTYIVKESKMEEIRSLMDVEPPENKKLPGSNDDLM